MSDYVPIYLRLKASAMLKKWTIASIGLLFIISCADNKSGENVRMGTAGKQTQTTSNANEATTEQIEVADPFADVGTETSQEPKKQVDGAALKIFKLTISSQRNKSSLGLNAGYTPDGKADYIEYMICPLEATGKKCPEGIECARGGECFEGVTVYNRVRIPLIYGGEVLYKFRACVDRDNATGDETCGDWEVEKYNSRLYDPYIARLQFDGENIKKELGKLVGEDYRNALATFADEARKCDALNAEVKRVLDSKVRVVDQFLRAPTSWFVKAGEDIGDTVLGEGGSADVLNSISKLGEQVSHQMEKACVALGKSTTDFVCTFLKGVAGFGKQFLSAMSPVTALGTISNAVHDVYYGTFKGEGDKLVPKGCFAEQNLQRTVQAIETQMQSRIQKLQVIKQNLDQKGESLNP